MPVTNFIWDPETDAYLMETDGSDQTTAVYTNEPVPYGSLISQRRGAETSYHHQDGLGNTRELTNASEVVTDTNMYDAWGVNVDSTGTTENPFKWRGRNGYHFDAATGEYYARSRTYRPGTGRWMTADPLYFVDGPNLYAAHFVPNSLDPSGEEAVTVVCLVAVAIGSLFLCGCETPPPPPPRTDDECCKAANDGGLRQLRGERFPASGIVICCDGRKVSCAWRDDPSYRFIPPETIEKMLKCTRVHEDTHHDDIPACPNAIPSLERPGWGKGKDPKTEECDAYDKELKCLAEEYKKCTTDACRSNLGNELTSIWGHAKFDLGCKNIKRKYL